MRYVDVKTNKVVVLATKARAGREPHGEFRRGPVAVSVEASDETPGSSTTWWAATYYIGDLGALLDRLSR